MKCSKASLHSDKNLDSEYTVCVKSNTQLIHNFASFRSSCLYPSGWAILGNFELHKYAWIAGLDKQKPIDRSCAIIRIHPNRRAWKYIHTNKRTDGCYQVRYLPALRSIMIYSRMSCFFWECILPCLIIALLWECLFLYFQLSYQCPLFIMNRLSVYK